MTGPTTAEELLELAAQQLQLLDEQQRRGATASDARALTAAWPGFARAGSRLLAALDVPAAAHQRPAWPAAGPADGPVVPDRRLARAGDLVAAAADLLSTHDRTALPPDAAGADIGYAARHLVSGARLIVTAAAGHAAQHPALLAPLGDAASALSVWSALLPGATAAPAEPDHAPGGPAALADARTQLYAFTAGTPGRATTTATSDATSRAAGTSPAIAAPDTGSAGPVRQALVDWQHAALAALQQPAPSSDDLRDTALFCGGLLALSQALLRAHAASTGQQDAAVTAAAQRMRTAGQAWTAAAASWRRLASGGRPDPDLHRASVALDRAVAQLARTDGQWVAPAELLERAGAKNAAALGHSALGVVQAVADRSAPLVEQLVETGAVYVAARQLPPAEDRLHAWAERRWLPLPAEHHCTLTDAYRPLPALTAAARLGHPAATSPSTPAAVPAAQGVAVPGAPPGPEPEQGTRTLAARRWSRTLAAVDERLVTDPHLPALAAALDRVALAGVDVPSCLAAATARRPLPAKHPARALHYRLVDDVPAASIPYTQPAPERPAPARALPVHPQPRPTQPRPARAAPTEPAR